MLHRCRARKLRRIHAGTSARRGDLLGDRAHLSPEGRRGRRGTGSRRGGQSGLGTIRRFAPDSVSTNAFPLSNAFLLVAVLVALAVHVAALNLPPTQFVLRVEPIDLETWIRIVPVAATILAAIELHRYLRRGKRSSPRSPTAGAAHEEGRRR